MALRDRQIGGYPLPWLHGMILSIIMVLCVPVLGYNYVYPFFRIPKEFWPFFAFASTALQIRRQSGIVELGMESPQTFFGKYTGISYPAGYYMLPELPLPIATLLLEHFILHKNVYERFFWCLVGNVRVESVTVTLAVEGLTRDGARVRLQVLLRLELMNVAIFSSQTREGTDLETLKQIVIAEYSSAVKSAVISQHSVEELMRGYNSTGSAVLNEWMTEAWKLVKTLGVELAASPLTQVEILSEQVRHAWDRVQAKEIFNQSGEALGEAFANFRQKNPGLTEEIAWVSFASSQGLPLGTSINIIKVK